ncbi:2OG-Fe(II) oxygenase [Vitiosangium sp. GDMCC 1.1324]|uniref:2OG-Fe(II) oxygenase n=1 Tax=Vitiosangium sp. (strain GDMCC 1.1324) TaxID=2138576 RepID=UPI000D3D053D|nr:2OG-Fe(II) oxygenase [Vitiosangium sp. GDMCC 1.1324]PTL77392.1 hypothetical protein DAT35_44060 [Vitiosangium sp. GDMCC 1.1324]
MRFQPPWGGAFRLHTFHHHKPEALPEGTVDAIRSAILGSSLLGETNLTDAFAGTYGFTITFRREGLSKLTGHFPAFVPFLEKALLPDCNAFLLNPLLIQNGRGVEPHLDRSMEFYGEGIGSPLAVSVLYVHVPEHLEGGELRLYHRGRKVAAVKPTPRTLVTFRGDLMHEVVAVQAGAPMLSAARVSLVVEQYRVPQALLAGVPHFELRTRDGASA